jgi:uridine monophosphate synthetase
MPLKILLPLLAFIIMPSSLSHDFGADAPTATVTTSAESADVPATRMSFRSKLETRVAVADTLLCVGLDPHFRELFPEKSREASGEAGVSSAASSRPTEEEVADAAYTFCKTLIDATEQYAACYKPNAAFFESIGPRHGAEALRRVIRAIPIDIPVLLDAKRGDIGTTATAYAEASYEGLGADAVTLSPLMGFDSVLPFVSGT